ncbi:MAG: hypothetical protein RIS14_2 [Pseudomonadota bacterium]
MSTVKPFHLPDLGEGLPDAEIVEWHVKIGDVVRLDAPLVSMETAKAVVDVPSPFSGKVLALAGQPGDVILTGAVLVEIELDPNLPQRADAQDTGHHHGAPAAQAAPASTPESCHGKFERRAQRTGYRHRRRESHAGRARPGEKNEGRSCACACHRC